MRPPQRRRPRARSLGEPLSDEDRNRVLRIVRYVGSGLHKSAPILGLEPKLRADKSKCPSSLADLSELNQWLRAAIEQNRISSHQENGLPRYVWHFHDGIWFEGRLGDPIRGDYHGYPIELDEVPYRLRA